MALMQCTDIIDNFYNNIAVQYKSYIGQTIDVVIKGLAVNHVILPYRIKDLQNSDVIVWRSARDNIAHVTVYNDYRFYCAAKDKIKSHEVLLMYRGMLKPKYIVRLEDI